MPEKIELLWRDGAGEIGGPYFFEINFGKTKIGVDCGMSSKKEGASRVPDFKGLAGLNGLLITHAHLDHVGAVPCLAKKSVLLEKSFGIFMSPPTRDFSEIQWSDTLKIAENNGKMPEFDECHVSEVFSRIKLINSAPFEIGGVKIRPVKTAHILGARGFILEYGGKKFFFTGDFSLTDYPAIDPFELDFIKNQRIDCLITESTYAGSDDASSFAEERERFERDIEKCLNGGKQILIPVFTIDRGQKLLWLLQSLGLEDYVYIDGGARKTFEIYNHYKNGFFAGVEDCFVPFGKKGNYFRNGILRKKPAIILATSGMIAENTLSYWYAAALLESRTAVIMFVGYQAPKTPGGILKVSKQGEKIFWAGEEMKINARIESYNFTAHAREREIAQLIETVNPKVTMFAHGEPERIQKFLDRHPYLPGHKIIAENGERYNF